MVKETYGLQNLKHWLSGFGRRTFAELRSQVGQGPSSVVLSIAHEPDGPFPILPSSLANCVTFKMLLNLAGPLSVQGD